MHGLDVEAEIMQALAQEITAETRPGNPNKPTHLLVQQLIHINRWCVRSSNIRSDEHAALAVLINRLKPNRFTYKTWRR